MQHLTHLDFSGCGSVSDEVTTSQFTFTRQVHAKLTRLLDSVQVLSGFAAAWTSLAPADRLAPLPLRQLNLNGKALRFAAFQNNSTLNAHQAAAT